MMKLIIAIVVSVFVISACNEQAQQHVARQELTYTCPMHPQIIQHHAGRCPVCGMDLVLFDRTKQEGSLILDANQIALANIVTATTGDTAQQQFTSLNGRVIVNPEKSSFISSRVSGRIEKLFVKGNGITIRRGDPLYSIYSEDLVQAQQEYLVARAQQKQFPADDQFRKIAEAAKQRLSILGQTEEQIRLLEASNRPGPSSTYFATASGVISENKLSEGLYVREGESMMRIEDLEEVWIEADVYAHHEGPVKPGMQVQVAVEDKSVQQMRITSVDPVFENGAQLFRLRGVLHNTDKSIVPGMHATVLVPSMNRKKKTVPASAVIRDRYGAHIWIETSKGHYSPRQVEVEDATHEDVQIKTGIKEGEKIVVKGGYLLYSEYVLKRGVHPLQSHQH